MGLTEILPRSAPARDHCPTCFRPVNMPYRRIVQGRVVERCVDPCHDDQDFHRFSNEDAFVSQGQAAVRRLQLVADSIQRRGW